MSALPIELVTIQVWFPTLWLGASKMLLDDDPGPCLESHCSMAQMLPVLEMERKRRRRN